jgi:hypothetical protein
MCNIFFLCSYWEGCLRLLKAWGHWQKALQIVVKLNDMTLLNPHSQSGESGHVFFSAHPSLLLTPNAPKPNEQTYKTNKQIMKIAELGWTIMRELGNRLICKSYVL